MKINKYSSHLYYLISSYSVQSRDLFIVDQMYKRCISNWQLLVNVVYSIILDSTSEIVDIVSRERNKINSGPTSLNQFDFSIFIYSGVFG